MKKTFCDLCEKEIVNNYNLSEEGYMLSRSGFVMDICKDCYSKTVEFIRSLNVSCENEVEIGHVFRIRLNQRL